MSKKVPKRPKTLDCRLIPAHLKVIRKMRALVNGGNRAAGSASTGSPTPEDVRMAEAYLARHASCEAIFLGRDSGTDLAKPNTGAGSQMRVCGVCRKRKPVTSIDETSGTCVKCQHAQQDATVDRKPKTKAKAKAKAKQGPRGDSKTNPAKAQPTRSGQCPVCLQRVKLAKDGADRAIAPHTKQTSAGPIDCRGAGSIIFRERRDAMDHRVSGTFEGGRRH